MGNNGNENNKGPDLYNLDHKWIMNTVTGRFYMKFTPEQENVIKDALEKDIPICSFAYPNVSDVTMMHIITFLYDSSPGGYTPNPVQVWKIMNTRMDVEQKMWAIIALSFGVELVEEIAGIEKYSKELLNIIVMGISCGVNIVKKIYPGMDITPILSEMILLTDKMSSKGKDNIVSYAYEEKETLY